MAADMSDRKYRVRDSVVFRETRGTLTMAFDRERGIMHECNDTASAVLHRLDGERTVAQVIALLAEEFDAEHDEIERDVAYIIERFIEVEILDQVDR